MKNKLQVLLISGCFLGLFLWNLLVEPVNYSDSERRKLADFPEVSVSHIFSGDFSKDFETYAVERFVARDMWRSMKAYASTELFLQKDNHDIFQAGGHISKLEYPMNEAALYHAVEVFSRVNDKYLQDCRVYLSVIPDKNRYLAAEYGYLSMDYEEFSGYFAERMDFAEYIEIADLLEADDYYVTDTHWRQEKIEDVAERLKNAMSVNTMGADLTEEYAVKQLSEPFEGVYLGQSALHCEPDRLVYLTNEIIESASVEVWNGSGVSKKEDAKSVYNMKLAKGRDPYEMFLSGNQPIVRVKNEGNTSGRRLILFRDSFGSSIAPLLLDSYSEIVLVDLRYVASDVLGELVDFTNADALFLYSTIMLNHSLSLK